MVKDSMPRVSLCLPVYNGERYLRATMDSLLGQTFGTFELIISDNASTDGTADICREYTTADRRVRYTRQPRNVGSNANYNQVIRMARAPYVKWCAHDDLCAPEYLESALAVLENDPDAVLCHSRSILIDECGERLPGDGSAWFLSSGERVCPDPPLVGRPLRASSPHVRLRDVLLRTKLCFEIFGLMRRTALLRTPLFRHTFGWDKVILAELALLGTWQEVDEPLWMWRCHSGGSGNLTVHQRMRWATARRGRTVLPVAHMLPGYLAAVGRAPLSSAERLRCYAEVVRKAVEPDNVRNLLVPGPGNYFGIDLSRPAPPSRPVPDMAGVSALRASRP
jgi:Glycosyl transferase family 2